MRLRSDRAEARRAEAAARAAAAAQDNRSPAARLAELDRLYGRDLGAGRERARLQAALVERTTDLGTSSTPAPPTTPSSAQAELVATDAATGARMTFADCRVRILVNGRDLPVLSISQIRRLGEQEGFDAKIFIDGWRKVVPRITKETP